MVVHVEVTAVEVVVTGSGAVSLDGEIVAVDSGEHPGDGWFILDIIIII